MFVIRNKSSWYRTCLAVLKLRWINFPVHNPHGTWGSIFLAPCPPRIMMLLCQQVTVDFRA